MKIDIKNIDKKIILGSIIGVLAIIVVVIVLVLSGAKKETSSENPSQNSEVTENGDSQQQDTNTQDKQDTSDTSAEDDNTEDVTEDGSKENTEDDTISTEGNENNNNAENDSSQSTTKPNGDIVMGNGDADNPIVETLDESLVLTTISIKPGESVYYEIYRAGGLGFVINDQDACVQNGGKRYDAVNGVVSFVVENAMSNEAVAFVIGNKGTSEKKFTIHFSNMEGSRLNPNILQSLDNVSISLPEGEEVGRFYKYVAAKTGVIRFYIVSATEDSELSVTNNNTMLNRTFEDEEYVQQDAQGNLYYEVPVTQGDELMINVCVKRTRRGKYPATDVVWKGIYS